jgi:hypothetical protein
MPRAKLFTAIAPKPKRGESWWVPCAGVDQREQFMATAHARNEIGQLEAEWSSSANLRQLQERGSRDLR